MINALIHVLEGEEAIVRNATEPGEKEINVIIDVRAIEGARSAHIAFFLRPADAAMLIDALNAGLATTAETAGASAEA